MPAPTIGGVFLGASSDVLVLPQQAGNPGGTANTGKVYTKDVAGTSALFFQDSAGSVFQLTTPGSTGASNFSYVTLAADFVANAGAGIASAIPGLLFPVVAGGTYTFNASLIISTTIVTNGGKIVVDGPTFTYLATRVSLPTATGAEVIRNANSYLQPADPTVITTTYPFLDGNIGIVSGIVQPSASGNIQLLAAPEGVGGGASNTIRAGSVLSWFRNG